jgi:hypothetical protein
MTLSLINQYENIEKKTMIEVENNSSKAIILVENLLLDLIYQTP